MSRRRQIYIILATIVIGAIACRKPFEPAIIAADNNYLVVEGVINVGNDSTFIRLSRTTQLSDTTRFKPELKATLYITDDANVRHNFTELGGGKYACTPLNITNAQKCQLHIVSSAQKEYVSDDIEVDKTPDIDSLSYAVNGMGVQFYVNTHDASNKVKYYRWDFDETWQYVSYSYSYYLYRNGQVEVRLPKDNIYNCWVTFPSNQILLGSAASLSLSVINKQPVAYVDVSSGKLALGYSMLLKQYALTKQAYEYWQKLKKNSEQLGSIFDAQPSELKGNLHAVANANEPVIGYITASTITTKRVVIDHNSLPFNTGYYYPPPTQAACDTKGIALEPAATFSQRLQRTFGSGDSVLIGAKGLPGGPITSYSYSVKECVDCRAKIRGGTTVKPSFWFY